MINVYLLLDYKTFFQNFGDDVMASLIALRILLLSHLHHLSNCLVNSFELHHTLSHYSISAFLKLQMFLHFQAIYIILMIDYHEFLLPTLLLRIACCIPGTYIHNRTAQVL